MFVQFKWACGRMVDAADLKASENPMKSMTLSESSLNVHGRFSAGYRAGQTKN